MEIYKQQIVNNMKLIIMTCIAFFAITSLKAQQIQVAGKTFNKGDKINTEVFDSYIGLWEWKQDNKVFRLKLTQKTDAIPGIADFKANMLIGGYQFIVDGTEQYNDLSNNNLSKAKIASTKIVDNAVPFYITDGSTNHRGQGTLKLINTNAIKWEIGERKKEFKLKGEGSIFSLPLTMILKRVAEYNYKIDQHKDVRKAILFIII